MNPNNVILTSEGFTLRPELNALALEKGAKVLRHAHPAVDRVRVHLRMESRHSSGPCFVARATAEHAGPDHIAHAKNEEPAAAIHAVMAKLERELRDAAGVRKHARHAETLAE